MRSLTIAALVLLLAAPALAGSPFTYHGKSGSSPRGFSQPNYSRSYRSAVPPNIVGGRSVSPSSRYYDGYRSHRYGRGRSYGRGGDVIIIVPRESYGRRWR